MTDTEKWLRDAGGALARALANPDLQRAWRQFIKASVFAESEARRVFREALERKL